MSTRLALPAAFIAVILAFNAHSASNGFLYVLKDDVPTSNAIYGYSVNESTGELTPLTGFPVTQSRNGDFGNASERLAIDRVNGRLYIINTISVTASAFLINTDTGALTATSYKELNVNRGGENSIAVHPSGSMLTVADSGSGISSFLVTATTGTAVPGNPVATGTPCFSSAYSTDGNFLYAGGSGTAMAGFQVNPATGELKPLTGSPFTIAPGSRGICTDSSGRIFTALNFTSKLQVFTTSDGIPAKVTINAFDSGLTDPVHGVLHPSGFYIVADRTGNRVGVFAIDGKDAATTLTAVTGSPFTSGGTAPQCLALNKDGKFLFLANSNTRNITTFSVNTSTGVLSLPATQAANTNGNAGILAGIGYFPPTVDLAVAVSEFIDPVGAGSLMNNLPYLVSVQNNGPADASGLVIAITQTLPPGVSAPTGSTSNGTFSTQTGLWTIGDLPAGSFAFLSLAQTIDATTATGTNVVSTTASVSAVNELRVNTADDSATQFTSVIFSLVSPATAAPSPAGVNQSVAFNVGTGGTGLTFAWEFGDGATASTQSAAHPYSAPGTYNAKVTITDGTGFSLASTVVVTILAPLVGGGNDTDGDGFSDDFETAASADPNSAASTPTGQPATPGAIKLLKVSKFSIKLNFAKPGKDSLTAAGSLDVAAGFSPFQGRVTVDVGGVVRGFTLDKKGAAKLGKTDALKIGIKVQKGVVNEQSAKFSFSFKSGSFAAAFADENLTGAANTSNASRTILIGMTFNNTIVQKQQALSYTAKQAKSGAAKQAD